MFFEFEPAEEHGEAHHEQQVADDGAGDAGLHHVNEPGTQREDGDDEFCGVAEGGDVVASIGVTHINRARHYFGEHLRQHAFKTSGEASLPPELRAASRIAEIIKAECVRQLSTREIQRRRLVGLQSAREVGPTFAALEAAGWVSQMEQPVGRGRPAKVYAVNPRLEDMT